MQASLLADKIQLSAALRMLRACMQYVCASLLSSCVCKGGGHPRCTENGAWDVRQCAWIGDAWGWCACTLHRLEHGNWEHQPRDMLSSRLQRHKSKMHYAFIACPASRQCRTAECGTLPCPTLSNLVQRKYIIGACQPAYQRCKMYVTWRLANRVHSKSRFLTTCCSPCALPSNMQSMHLDAPTRANRHPPPCRGTRELHTNKLLRIHCSADAIPSHAPTTCTHRDGIGHKAQKAHKKASAYAHTTDVTPAWWVLSAHADRATHTHGCPQHCAARSAHRLPSYTLRTHRARHAHRALHARTQAGVPINMQKKLRIVHACARRRPALLPVPQAAPRVALRHTTYSTRLRRSAPVGASPFVRYRYAALRAYCVC